MDMSMFVVTVYCLVDDWLKGRRVRQWGPDTQLRPFLGGGVAGIFNVAVLPAASLHLVPQRIAAGP